MMKKVDLCQVGEYEESSLKMTMGRVKKTMMQKQLI